MSVTLAYPAMGPILEFMEANKSYSRVLKLDLKLKNVIFRIDLTSRCPSLHAIDKSTTLRLAFLEFRTNSIQINDTYYILSHCKQKYLENQEQIKDKSSREALEPGEIQIGGNSFPKFRKFVKLRIVNEFGDETVRKLPQNLEIHMALKKLFNFLLGGRKTPIKVADELVLDLKKGDILRLPENLKIWVKTLNSERTDFEEILPILDPSCLPLETLKLENAQLHNLHNLVFRTAQNVEIWGVHDEDSENLDSDDDSDEEDEEDDEELWLSEFQKLPNKNIFIDYDIYNREKIVDLIKYWMENGKEIGTCFSFERGRQKVDEEVDQIKKEIGGYYRRRVALGYALILPINDETELMVIGAKMSKLRRRALHLVVQPKVVCSHWTDKFFKIVYSNQIIYALFAGFVFIIALIPYFFMLGRNANSWIAALFVVIYTILLFIIGAFWTDYSIFYWDDHWDYYNTEMFHMFMK
ncbi:Protein CBG24791 [Caenorhabditis briggsae]|uniref:Protein CBG24791 n=1 Tax=Caenorhabditis briggsae TaxID=6238 RepID=A8WLH9_CAEBR|nr:Protein CBG24791 [Caenorhabditis briggsae]CAP21324.1 Protein CBG24791 [Caenorhabditis briggsae]